MNILRIVQHPASVLKQVCSVVDDFNEDLQKLSAEMLYTIGRNEENQRRIGVGLAAPQVYQPIRLVVVAAPGFPEIALVNPVIERGKGWESANESCLSLPMTHGEVFRSTVIWVAYQDLNGTKQSLKAKDFYARVIQHEVDHLDGIEFTDRIEEQKQVTA